MSGDTTTTLTNIINEVLIPQSVSTIFYNDWLFRHVPPEKPRGGSKVNWPVEVTGTNNAETYAEGDPMASPNANSILAAAVSKQPFQVTAKISNIAIDYLLENKLNLNAPELYTVNKAIQDLKDLVVTTNLALIEAGIDSAGTYAGINKSTYTGFASYEQATTTALTLAHVEDMIEALRDNDRACDFTQLEIWMPWNQVTNFARLRFGTTNHPWNTDRSNNFDAGKFYDANGNVPPYNGIPVFGVPDMTDTVILALQRNLLHFWETRPVRAEFKSVLEDAQVWEITCNYVATYDNPQKAGKLSGKTA